MWPEYVTENQTYFVPVHLKSEDSNKHVFIVTLEIAVLYIVRIAASLLTPNHANIFSIYIQ